MSDSTPHAPKHSIIRVGGNAESVAVKYWEIIADNLSKANWTWGCVSAVDCEGRTIWIADAHRDNGKRLVERADEILTAFSEIEKAIRAAKTLRPAEGGRPSI
jgi:hypothetical protein